MGVAAFTEHERKLFRRRLVLELVVGIALLAIAVTPAVGLGDWSYPVVFTALALLGLAGPGLYVTGRATKLERFDEALTQPVLAVVTSLRRWRAYTHCGLFIVLLVLSQHRLLGLDRPALMGLALGGVCCALAGAWLLRREALLICSGGAA